MSVPLEDETGFGEWSDAPQVPAKLKGLQERLRRMDWLQNVPLPKRPDRSYQGSHSKLATSWYGSSLAFALGLECRSVLALKASHVQPAS